ncbi:hypothetical protein RchiOBHm_Chr3g0484831 [Rosa chinensis]|uniref:Uncharacterized protein n=1 Tax=Rosa chinensis TaxID=74649 RepID=A0A2P6REV7_ROSCH|nr:hypothetical protein RchiOBHm_Chr3g0484831 [Rosa chinensis]
MPWSSKKHISVVHVNHMTSNLFFIKFSHRDRNFTNLCYLCIFILSKWNPVWITQLHCW